MKKLFLSLFIALLCLGTLPLLKAEASPDTCSYSDRVVTTDALVTVCAGDIINHTPSGLNFTVRFYNDRYIKLLISGSRIRYATVYKDQFRVITASNGSKVKLSYPTFGAFQITSETSVGTCHRNDRIVSTDALVTVCPGDIINHSPSGLTFTVQSYNDRTIKLRLVGSNTSYITLYKNQFRTITATNGNKVKLSYPVLGAFQITSEISSSPTCNRNDRVVNTDALVTVCAGDIITHSPSGLKFVVESYTDQYIKLRLSGSALSYITLYKNQFRTITATNGNEVKLSYPVFGAFQITSEYSSLNITSITGNKSSYTSSEKINLRIKGIESDGSIPKQSEGWHVQYYTYEVSDSGHYLQEYVSQNQFNGTFDGTYWNANYQAPSVSGKYYTEVVLYCSKQGSQCWNNSATKNLESRQKLYFDVIDTTPSMSCGNSAGNDGLYSACVGDTITHYTSGLKAKVTYYNSTYANVFISGLPGNSTTTLRLNKNSRTYIGGNNGYEVIYSYTETSDRHGAFIQIDSNKSSVNNQYNIRGRVISENGNALNRARIDIAVNGTGAVVSQISSDANGNFSFSNLSLDQSNQYFIVVYDSQNYGDRNMTDYSKILDLNNHDPYFDVKLYYSRNVSFSYKWNANGISSIPGEANGYTNLSSSKNNGSLSGFSFVSGVVGHVSSGSFYIGAEEDGVVKMWGNNRGQGGSIDLGYGSISQFNSVPTSGYNQQGVPLIVGHNYAVYDSGKNAYAIFHVNSMTIER